MKARFLFIALSFFAVASFAQGSPSPAPAPQSQSTFLASKADSFAVVTATKLGIDTNASTAELGQRIDELTSIAPGKHAGPLKWYNFLIYLFGTLVMGYFVVKHIIVRGAKALGGKTTAVILVLLAFGITGCTGTSHLLTPNSIQVNEQIGKQGYYLQEDVIIHTLPNQNDTAGVLIIGPDSVTNSIFNQVKDFIQSKLGTSLPAALKK
jgi:hypothetical protein